MCKLVDRKLVDQQQSHRVVLKADPVLKAYRADVSKEIWLDTV